MLCAQASTSSAASTGLVSAMACFLVHASSVDTLDELCTGFYIGLGLVSATKLNLRQQQTRRLAAVSSCCQPLVYIKNLRRGQTV